MPQTNGKLVTEESTRNKDKQGYTRKYKPKYGGKNPIQNKSKKNKIYQKTKVPESDKKQRREYTEIKVYKRTK